MCGLVQSFLVYIYDYQQSSFGIFVVIVKYT